MVVTTPPARIPPMNTTANSGRLGLKIASTSPCPKPHQQCGGEDEPGHRVGQEQRPVPGRLVPRDGGRLSVLSPPGDGTTLHVQLPAGPRAAMPPPGRPGPAPRRASDSASLSRTADADVAPAADSTIEPLALL